MWVTHMLMIWQGPGVSSRSMPSDSPDLSSHILSTCGSQSAKHRCAFPHRKLMLFLASSFYIQELIPTSDCPEVCFLFHKAVTEMLDAFFHVLFTQKMFSATSRWRFWGGWLHKPLCTCSGKMRRSPSFSQALSCSWLSSWRSCFKSVFSQLLFPGLPAAAAAVCFSQSPFFGRGLSSPAALSHPPSYSSPSPAPYLLPIPPTTTDQALLPSPCTQPGGAGSAFAAHSPSFYHHCLASSGEKEPGHNPAWPCPTSHTCPEHFVSAESWSERKGSYVRHVEK